MSTQDVIEHSSGGDPVIEYLFPCIKIPENTKTLLHPWLKQMVGRKREEVRTIIESRWKGLDEVLLLQLAKSVLNYLPRSIVLFRDEAWVVLENPSQRIVSDVDPMDFVEKILVIPPPPNTKLIEDGIKKTKCADSNLFRKFVEFFGGFRYRFPGHQGDYLVPAEWSRLVDYSPHTYLDTEEWLEALIMYIESGGDMLLMHPTGKIGWFLDWDKIVEVSQDFKGFLQYLINHGSVIPQDRSEWET